MQNDAPIQGRRGDLPAPGVAQGRPGTGGADARLDRLHARDLPARRLRSAALAERAGTAQDGQNGHKAGRQARRDDRPYVPDWLDHVGSSAVGRRSARRLAQTAGEEHRRQPGLAGGLGGRGRERSIRTLCSGGADRRASRPATAASAAGAGAGAGAGGGGGTLCEGDLFPRRETLAAGPQLRAVPRTHGDTGLAGCWGGRGGTGDAVGG